MKGTNLPPTLVLGGSGFLGVHVLESVAASGRRTVSACRSAPRDRGGAVEHAPFDAFEEGTHEALLEQFRPDRVINCCALSRGGACEERPERAARINAELPAALGRWAARAGGRLIHVSTDLVFGGVPPRPTGYREEDPPEPLSVYGKSKAAGEAALLTAFPAALVVRLPLLFGDSRGRGLGASDSLLASLDRGERPLLFTDEYRTPLDVVEAAAALALLLESELAGILHVAGPERLSRYQLGELVLRGRGEAELGQSEAEAGGLLKRAKQAELDLVPPRPPDVSLDARRAREVLRCPLSPPSCAFGAPSDGGASRAP